MAEAPVAVRRNHAKRLSTALFVVLTVVGCRMNGIHGWLGVNWGDDVTAAASHLGLAVDRWDPWQSGSPFTVAIDWQHPVEVAGAQALPRVIRSGNSLQGLQLVFRSCSGDTERHVRDKIAQEFKLTPSDGGPLYHVWKDGSLVHFVSDAADSTCTLTVASPMFGKAFEEAQIRAGLGSLSGQMRPQ